MSITGTSTEAARWILRIHSTCGGTGRQTSLSHARNKQQLQHPGGQCAARHMPHEMTQTRAKGSAGAAVPEGPQEAVAYHARTAREFDS